MDQKQIDKVCELMQRTMKLNENAPSKIYYGLEFSGHVEGVFFRKYEEVYGEYTMRANEYAYIDRDDLGHPLSAIEHIIATEEDKQKEARNLWE